MSNKKVTIMIMYLRYLPFFFYGNIGVSLMLMTLVALHRFFGVFYSDLLNRFFNRVGTLQFKRSFLKFHMK